MLQLTAMLTSAVAVVESSLTMLDAEELSHLSSAALIKELEYTAANTVKMLELDAQVVWNAFYGRNVVIEIWFSCSSSCKLLSRPDPLEGRVESKRRKSRDLLRKSLGHHL